jgi:hypothetical protein
VQYLHETVINDKRPKIHVELPIVTEVFIKNERTERLQINRLMCQLKLININFCRRTVHFSKFSSKFVDSDSHPSFDRDESQMTHQ